MKKRLRLIPACGINSLLIPGFYAAGRLTAVKLAYPRDDVKLQLGYAALYDVH